MYAKHDSLVDADASGANTAQNTLNHIHGSFKDTHSGITEKPTRDCVLLYNNVGFSRKFRKKGLSISVFENPPSFGAPCVGNHCEYSQKSYTFKN